MLAYPRRVLATALATCLLPAATGCDSGGGGGTARETPAPPPVPRPALTEQQVAPVLARFAKQSKQARRTLSPKLAAAAFTGSSAQMETAKYKVFKANKVTIKAAKYTSVVGAAPKLTGYPKWFFAAMTDKGSSPVTRDIILFVQDRAGSPWRAAYTPFADKPVKGPVARGVDVADYPDVVPAGDTSLVLPPSQLPAALAQLLDRGKSSPRYKDFTLLSWMKDRTSVLRSDRETFKSTGWTGTVGHHAAGFPTYAVRTKSGGALVWTALDYRRSFKHTKPGGNMTWDHQSWGDLLRPFTGRSTLKKTFTSVERIETLVYVPPRGKGKIRILANRWAPVQIEGR